MRKDSKESEGRRERHEKDKIAELDAGNCNIAVTQ